MTRTSVDSKSPSKLRPFDPDKHHVVVEILKHTTSPLSIALFTLAGFMYSTRRQTRAYFEARRVVRSAASSAASSGRGGGGGAVDAAPRNVPAAPGSTQAYSTFAASRQRQTPFGSVAGFSTFAAALGARQQRQSLLVGSSSLCSTPLASPSPMAKRAMSTDSNGKWTFGSTIHDNLHEKLAKLWEPEVVDVVAHHVIDLPSVRLMESYIATVHSMTGTPWWLSICCATIGMRIFALPFIVAVLKNQWRTKRIAHDVDKFANAMQMAPSAAERYTGAELILETYKKNKCHPLRPLMVATVFAPTFISYFLAVQNTAFVADGMTNGGILWFKDLSEPDTSFVLPVFAAISWLAVAEFGGGRFYNNDSNVRLWTRMTAVGFIGIMHSLPCAVYCFWITSNLTEVLRIRAFNSPRVRTWLGLPQQHEFSPESPPQ